MNTKKILKHKILIYLLQNLLSMIYKTVVRNIQNRNYHTSTAINNKHSFNYYIGHKIIQRSSND